MHLEQFDDKNLSINPELTKIFIVEEGNFMTRIINSAAVKFSLSVFTSHLLGYIIL